MPLVPVISVMCCTYNQEKYIKNCLEGFVNQKTKVPFQVIVHDDASVDSTPQIIREYERKYPEIIKGIYQKENQFSIHPKRLQKFVYPMLAGKYVASCEGDDFWCDKEKLQKQYDAMEQNPDCSICLHKVKMIYENGVETEKYIPSLDFYPDKMMGEDYIRQYLLAKMELFHTSSFFVKRDILFSIPKSMDDSFFVGDVPIILWCAANGNLLFQDYVGSCYRMMSQGSTNQALKNRNYAIMRQKTSVEGLLAFNAETGGKYWEYMKHDLYMRKAQLYFYDKSSMSSNEKKQVFAELSLKEKITAQIKFTKSGNILRNIREIIRLRRYKTQ